MVASGSSSLGIRSKFKDSLAGRKRVFTVFPLSFREFLRFKERQDLADLLKGYSALDDRSHLPGDVEKLRFHAGEFEVLYEAGRRSD